MATAACGTCSRSENAELFRLAIGGYGLFGVITRVRLRLMRAHARSSAWSLIDVDELMPAFAQRIADGLSLRRLPVLHRHAVRRLPRRGVFSCYRPLPVEPPIPAESEGARRRLGRAYLSLARRQAAGLRGLPAHYLSTSGQIYWSDTHQLSVYIDDYHVALDAQLNARARGTEMITEIYVPRAALGDFLTAVRADFRQHGVHLDLRHGPPDRTDDESFLAWAREPWACRSSICTSITRPSGSQKAATDFRRLIDRAIAYGGSYYLTYHRWAERAPGRSCYPQFAEFLRLKRRYDPNELFQSDWYRHYRELFADRL